MTAPSDRDRVPGHRYQRIGTCQCRIRENDSLSGMWNSLERLGVRSRLAMSPAQHAVHIADVLAARRPQQLALELS